MGLRPGATGWRVEVDACGGGYAGQVRETVGRWAGVSAKVCFVSTTMPRGRVTTSVKPLWVLLNRSYSTPAARLRALPCIVRRRCAIDSKVKIARATQTIEKPIQRWVPIGSSNNVTPSTNWMVGARYCKQTERGERDPVGGTGEAQQRRSGDDAGDGEQRQVARPAAPRRRACLRSTATPCSRARTGPAPAPPTSALRSGRPRPAS